MPPNDEFSVRHSLATWKWLLGPSNVLGVRRRIFSLFVTSIASQVLVGTVVVLSFLAAIHAQNLIAASNSANVCCGFYSCLGADVTFFWRQRRAYSIVERLERLFYDVERLADSSDAKSELIRASQMNRRMTRLQVCFGSAMVGSVWLQVCLTGRAYSPIWPMPESELGQLYVSFNNDHAIK
ncbi:uncharacterized protein LOC127750443 isoform X2 [Frankliniella occidentalis]|uniref:Uncharacterized protein LOC127750443 isoform X2 n=1 Tax=Frankliniella occidentalis TaxID=133901 RepID=A0A9C6X2V2_FRAOC|nr:uncharacterized protein LOC127750443 isoform X2 [Frankliniella occidentalis]XP_052128106.1 uncharacterized protein LOC127750443 isoform X2 [Frankliniella occidentalis]